MPDKNFFVDIFQSNSLVPGVVFSNHWHEHIQFFYFTKGEAMIKCSSKKLHVNKGDFVIINSNELHYMENLCCDLSYYTIRVDLSFLFSNQADSCQTKYLVPLAENLILFKHLVRNNAEIIQCTEKIIQEYYSKQTGYELSIKSYLLRIIVILIRNHIEKILTQQEFNNRISKLNNFSSIIEYIELNYCRIIAIEELSSIAHVSKFHFCRLFKELTGKTATEYINHLRIEKACKLLIESDLSMTEITLSCGFNDANYFSRVFKSFKNLSPSSFRKEHYLT